MDLPFLSLAANRWSDLQNQWNRWSVPPPMMSPSTAGSPLGTHQFREFLFGLLVSQTFSVSTVTFPPSPDKGCLWDPGVPKLIDLWFPHHMLSWKVTICRGCSKIGMPQNPNCWNLHFPMQTAIEWGPYFWRKSYQPQWLLTCCLSAAGRQAHRASWYGSARNTLKSPGIPRGSTKIPSSRPRHKGNKHQVNENRKSQLIQRMIVPFKCSFSSGILAETRTCSAIISAKKLYISLNPLETVDWMLFPVHGLW
jgi:hypothetical protein